MHDMVVFTGVFGRPDVLCEPAVPLDGVDLVCYTDLEFTGQSAFRMIELHLDSLSPPKRNRRVKIWWPEIFDCFDYSLYMDSNVELRVDPHELIRFLEPGSDIAVFRHPDRDCPYQEGRVCMRAGMADSTLVRRQLAYYRAAGLWPRSGLWAGTFILRRHTPRMQVFSETWWREVETFSGRDQISFPYVVWLLGTQVSEFPGNLRDNEFMIWHRHDARSSQFTSLKIASREG